MLTLDPAQFRKKINYILNYLADLHFELSPEHQEYVLKMIEGNEEFLTESSIDNHIPKLKEKYPVFKKLEKQNVSIKDFENFD